MVDDFAQIVLPNRPYLLMTARRLTRSGGDAEDLVQDTLLRAFVHWPSFRKEVGAVRPWLNTILIRLYLSRWRKAKRRPHSLVWEELADWEPEARSMTEGSTTSKDPVARAFFMHQEAADICEAIEALPSYFREPLVLRVDSGLSYTEIANCLALPVGTVRSRINRARERVQRTVRG